MLGKIEDGKRMTEDETVGHEFEQTMGDVEGQRGLACCSPWGHKESDTTGQLNNNNSCFVVLCTFVYSKVNQLYVYMYPLFLISLPFKPTQSIE